MKAPSNTEMTLIGIVIPVYNEEAVLETLLERLQAVTNTLSDRYIFEFVFVDDGSRDRSLEICRRLTELEPRLRVVELRTNYGQTAALQAGFDETRGEIVISLDADLQHFPEDIPAFLEKIEEGSDVVCGWRHQRREGIVRRWPSRVANMMIRYVSGLTVHDIGTTFRAYRRNILDDMQLLGENHRFVPVFAKAAGAKIVEVPIENIERIHGESNYGLGRTINVFIDLFFLYFFTRYLDRPIRIFGRLAIICFILAGLITVYLVAIFVFTGIPVVREHSGLFVVGCLLYLTAAQFLIGGIVAELISRLYFSSDGRKSYQVREVWQQDTAPDNAD